MPLISSAAAGKKAAPKAPARRRQAAVAQAATAVESPEVPDAAASDVALPSPPPTAPPPKPPSPLLPPPHLSSTTQNVPGSPPQDVTPPLDADRPTPAELSSIVVTVPDQIEDVELYHIAPAQDKEHATESESVASPVPLFVPQPVAEPAHELVPVPESDLPTSEDTRGEQRPVESSPAQEPDQTTSGNVPAQAREDERDDSNIETQETSQSRPQDQHAVVPPVEKRQDRPATIVDNSRPVKRPKKNSVRSNITVHTMDDTSSEDSSSNRATSPVTEPPEHSMGQQQSRTSRKAAKKPPKPTATNKRKNKSQANVAESAGPDDVSSGKVEQEPVRKRRRKIRRPSEQGNLNTGQPPDDDPELHEIDPGTMSMFALSHDSVHGKTSERERKMAAINWDEVAKQRREEASRIAAGHQDPANGDAAPSIENTDGATEGRAEEQPNQGGGLQFSIDAAGNIVADESSLQINRQEAVEEAERRGDPVEDVNDLTIRINRATWINSNRRDPTDRVPMWKSKSDPWSEEETDEFYNALRMFGTDFDIISKMFPGKTRRHVKLKFTREERLDPVRLNNALLGEETKPMSLEHYARATGNDVSIYTKYDGVAHALSLINESMKDKHLAMTEAATEAALLEKQRMEREKQKAAEKKQAGKKSRKKRGMGGGTLGGAPMEEGEA